MHRDRDHRLVVSNPANHWRGYGPNGGQVRRYVAHVRTLSPVRLTSVAAAEQQLGLGRERADELATLSPPERIWLDAIAEIHRVLGSEAPGLLRCADRASQRARKMLGERPGSWLVSLGAALLAFAPFLDAELVAGFFRAWLPGLGFVPETAPPAPVARQERARPAPAAVPIRTRIAASASVGYGSRPE